MKIQRSGLDLRSKITVSSLLFLIIMTSLPLVGGKGPNLGGFRPGNSDTISDAAADSSGVYVVGSTQGALPNQTGSGTNVDAYVRKYDRDGNELWTRQFGIEEAPSRAKASGVSVGSEGVYVVGFDKDAFVRKYDQNGTLLWNQKSGKISDIARGVATDTTGVYVVGVSFLECAPRAGPQKNPCPRENFIKKYDHDGNLLWTKQFEHWSFSQVTVGPTGVYVASATFGILPDQLGSSIVVRKYDLNGNELWKRDFGPIASGDLSVGISVHETGVYIVGTGAEILSDGFLGPGQFPFVKKYDLEGNELWRKNFGTEAFQKAQAVDVDSEGVYIVGFAGPKVTGLYTLTTPGELHAFVRKFDHNGKELWIRQFGSATGISANAVVVQSNNVYVVGWTSGTLPGQIGRGGGDAYVRTYDNNGNELWTRQFGTASFDAATDIALDSTGVYVVGATGGMLTNQVNAGGFDAFVRKYDRDGTEQWTRQFGTSQNDFAHGIAVDSTGVYVVGTLYSSSNLRHQEAFIKKFDHDGVEVWSKTVGTQDGAQIQQFMGIEVSPTGVYVIGSTRDIISVNAVGDWDILVMKYDIDGNELWTSRFRTEKWDRALDIALHSTYLYVVGEAFGTFSDQTAVHEGRSFVRKYDEDGNDLWTRQFGGNKATGVGADSTGVYVVGTAGQPLKGKGGSGGDYIKKFDHEGTELWTKQAATRWLSNVPSVLIQDAAVAVGDMGAYVGLFTGGVKKYSPDGDGIWARTSEPSTVNGVTSIALDSKGLYVVGMMNFQHEFRALGADAFVSRYTRDGGEVWTRQFGAEGETAVSVTPKLSEIVEAGPALPVPPSKITPPSGLRDPVLAVTPTTLQIQTPFSNRAGIVVINGQAFTTDSSGSVIVSLLSGTRAIIRVTPEVIVDPVVPGTSSGVRRTFSGWDDSVTSNTRAVTIRANQSQTLVARYDIEFFLQLTSEYGTPNGGGWQIAGSSVAISAQSSPGFPIRRVVDGWTGDAEIGSAEGIILMDSPKVVTATGRINYTQLFLTVGSLAAVGIGVAVILKRKKIVLQSPIKTMKKAK